MRHAVEAIEEALAARISRQEEIPISDGPECERDDCAIVQLPPLTTMKVRLYSACRQNGITRAELSRRLDWRHEHVDRLFRLDDASRLDQIEDAFAALNRHLEVRVRAA